MSAKSGSLSIACVQFGPQKLSVIQSSGVSGIQGLRIEVNGRTVRTFRIVRYIMGVHFSGVSVKRGSTVLLTATALHPAIAGSPDTW